MGRSLISRNHTPAQALQSAPLQGFIRQTSPILLLILSNRLFAKVRGELSGHRCRS